MFFDCVRMAQNIFFLFRGKMFRLTFQDIVAWLDDLEPEVEWGDFDVETLTFSNPYPMLSPPVFVNIELVFFKVGLSFFIFLFAFFVCELIIFVFLSSVPVPWHFFPSSEGEGFVVSRNQMLQSSTFGVSTVCLKSKSSEHIRRLYWEDTHSSRICAFADSVRMARLVQKRSFLFRFCLQFRFVYFLNFWDCETI